MAQQLYDVYNDPERVGNEDTFVMRASLNTISIILRLHKEAEARIQRECLDDPRAMCVLHCGSKTPFSYSVFVVVRADN